ncbi:MAG: hypothetical protein ACTHK7_18535 [Aureliella sp.]
MLTSRLTHGRIACIACMLALVAVIGSGCRRKVEDYIPEPQLAESAVRRALSAWQAGEPAGPIEDAQPAIFVTDTNRNPKQRLQGFEILGETPGRSGRTYVVELALAAPAEKVPVERVPVERVPVEKVKAEYIVVGIDPLWVFRREDYELLMHWDHYMPEETGETQTGDK